MNNGYLLLNGYTHRRPELHPSVLNACLLIEPYLSTMNFQTTLTAYYTHPPEAL